LKLRVRLATIPLQSNLVMLQVATAISTPRPEVIERLEMLNESLSAVDTALRRYRQEAKQDIGTVG
jgi:hypothetical protein